MISTVKKYSLLLIRRLRRHLPSQGKANDKSKFEMLFLFAYRKNCIYIFEYLLYKFGNAWYN